MRVLAVELYGDGVIARFLILGRTEVSDRELAGSDPKARVWFDLSDDLGTLYEWTRTGSTLVLPRARPGDPSPPNAPIIRGDAAFVPAVPPDAAQLTLITVEGVVEIRLREDRLDPRS